jgi:hypothetical protein
VLSSYHEFGQVIIMAGHAVALLVESESRGFDSRWCVSLEFFIDTILPAAQWPWG